MPTAPGSTGPAAEQTAITTKTTPAKRTAWYKSRVFKILAPAALMILVVALVLHSVKPKELEAAIEKMNPWWFLAAFGVAVLSWVGSTITLLAFAPKKLPVRDAYLTELASSYVGVAAPAGLGSIALTLRFLTKQGVETAQAVSTVVLVQLSQFLSSAVLVTIGILVAGVSPDVKIKWRIVAIVAAAVVAVLATILLVPKWRSWATKELKDVWTRFYPRAVWALKHPKQLSMALAGSVWQTGCLATAFYFSLLAFGYHIGVLKIAAIYLVFNTLGAMIPSPGGVGTIEASLAAGLVAAGLHPAVALSVAVTLRLATFYAQIPLGFASFEYLSRKQLI